MSADFDIAANSYDATFTNGRIGRMQRERVWDYLKNNLPNDRKLKILELNCGTGEDAVFLAKMGHQVIATDLSEQMLAMAQAKVKTPTLKKRIHLQKLNINFLDKIVFPHKFDLIFSNFGGLNCLAQKELDTLSNAIQKHLLPKGRFISVLMPSYCIMESIYFVAKKEWNKVFRRKPSKGISVNVDGIKVATWYYSPKIFENIFANHFSKKHSRPIGFLPSYFEGLTTRQPRLIHLDKQLYRYTKMSFASDHYLIDLQLK